MDDQTRSDANDIDRFLRLKTRPDGACDSTIGRQIMNYAFFHFVNSSWLKVDTQTELIPPNALSCIGERHIAVRKQDFLRLNNPAEDILYNPDHPTYDLHDLSHLSAATLCPELYGNKYADHPVNLDNNLTALIRSPAMKTANGPLFSDGIIFSEFLTELFTVEAAKITNTPDKHTYESLETTLATTLSSYLLSQTPLLHPSTQTSISLPHAITPIQLAVLAQNKAYELTASELEQRVFTRGGAAGDSRDVLDNMTAVERIEFLAENKSWLYFEVRNTIKHRAHKAALGIAARWWVGVLDSEGRGGEDEDDEGRAMLGLVRRVVESVEYEDWEGKRRVDLWGIIAGMSRGGGGGGKLEGVIRV